MASTRSWRATASSTSRGLGQQRALVVDDRAPARCRRPAVAQLVLRSASTPARLRAGRELAAASSLSLTESTVGSHTIRAPSRAAISTASGFMPADGAVERDRAEHLDARDDAA